MWLIALTTHSMVWPISSWKHGLGWFVIGNSSNIHKTNCQLRFHCYVSIINSKFTDSLIKILSWLFFYEPSSNINFCHLQILTSELFVVFVKKLTNPKSKSKSQWTTGFSLKSQFPTSHPATHPPGKVSKKQVRARYPKQKLLVYVRRLWNMLE